MSHQRRYHPPRAAQDALALRNGFFGRVLLDSKADLSANNRVEGRGTGCLEKRMHRVLTFL